MHTSADRISSLCLLRYPQRRSKRYFLLARCIGVPSGRFGFSRRLLIIPLFIGFRLPSGTHLRFGYVAVNGTVFHKLVVAPAPIILPPSSTIIRSAPFIELIRCATIIDVVDE